MPCAMTGSLKLPASPANAQPGPEDLRKKPSVSVAPRSLTSLTVPVSRALISGCAATTRSHSSPSRRQRWVISTDGIKSAVMPLSLIGNTKLLISPCRHWQMASRCG